MTGAAPLLLAALGGGWTEGAAQEPVPPHETFTIESAALGETRRINVYTPPGYQRYGTGEYPVLYMPDGGVAEDFPHVASAVDAAIRAGDMRRMIVVGIENTERRRDMTGPTEVEEDRRIAPRVGGSAAFRRFIGAELMPEVRRRYRASEESAIIGESLAGLFVVETFFLEPHLFDTYVALSPSLWWNGGALVRGADERIAAWRPRTRAGAVVYLSSADEDNIAPAAARLAESLRANAPPLLRWQYRPRPDLTHATIYRAEAPRVLRDLFPPVQWIRSITSRSERIPPPPPEPVTPLQRGTEVTREPAGAFALLREEYRAERRGTHSRDRWTKFHLTFDSPDGRVNVTLTDGLGMLSASARSPGCTVLVNYLQYGYDGDDRHLFGAMLTGLRTLVERCGSSMADPDQYRRQLEAAEADFPDAMRQMRALVTGTFSPHLERCPPPEQTGVPPSPFEPQCGSE